MTREDIQAAGAQERLISSYLTNRNHGQFVKGSASCGIILKLFTLHTPCGFGLKSVLCSAVV